MSADAFSLFVSEQFDFHMLANWSLQLDDWFYCLATKHNRGAMRAMGFETYLAKTSQANLALMRRRTEMTREEFDALHFAGDDR
jgi:hypothetical protein